MKHITPKKILVFLFVLFAFVVACSSCSVTKKSQHSTKQSEATYETHKKDSANISTTEEKKGTSEQESNKKVIDIRFQDQPDTPIKADDYFGLQTARVIGSEVVLPGTKIKTNRPAAVTIKANGDIQLNQAPKSIKITEAQDKQKIDTGSSKTTNAANVKTEDKKDTKKQTIVVENNTKRSKVFSMWWLLLLLIPASVWAYNRFIKPIGKLTEPIKWI